MSARQERITKEMEISINTAKQQKDEAKARIVELKQLLLDSDYKVLPDYDKTDDTITADRQAWRDEIRQLEQTL